MTLDDFLAKYARTSARRAEMQADLEALLASEAARVMGQRGGNSTSPAKVRAARRNGRKHKSKYAEVTK